ncbi:basic leucine zipper 23-like [Phalaenopsis equestris]|uniref:basic leucine zipper 23-like n=1 Tax=Phalaenopsis equestris TaxID=78828 RepID=UPI0009E4E846|nr:basic leucine zipper 23-like [Phalaenopsis equestris]
MMDDGEEVNYSRCHLLTNPDIPNSGNINELLRTIYQDMYTHTHMLAATEGDQGEGKELKKPVRKSLRNKEAVRKYRAKKKAHAAYLEEEVKKLRFINQQLLRRLQGQAALENEISRLKSLLGDVHAKIDIELGV